jgi:hypothetical protein
MLGCRPCKEVGAPNACIHTCYLDVCSRIVHHTGLPSGPTHTCADGPSPFLPFPTNQGAPASTPSPVAVAYKDPLMPTEARTRPTPVVAARWVGDPNACMHACYPDVCSRILHQLGITSRTLCTGACEHGASPHAHYAPVHVSMGHHLTHTMHRCM